MTRAHAHILRCKSLVETGSYTRGSRIYLVLLYILAFASCLCCSGISRLSWQNHEGARDRDDLPLQFSHIQGPLYLIENYNYRKTNYMLYASPEAIIFFGAGWNTKMARQLLWKAATLSNAAYAVLVLNSHHLQYTGGMELFFSEGLPVLIHPKGLALLQERWESMQKQMEQNFSTWQRQELFLPKALFTDRFSLLDSRIQLFCSFPCQDSASRDSAMAHDCLTFFHQEKVLYTASFLQVFQKNTWSLPCSQTPCYTKALQKIAALDAQEIIVGNGEARRRPSFLQKAKRRLKAKEGQCGQNQAKKKTSFFIK